MNMDSLSNLNTMELGIFGIAFVVMVYLVGTGEMDRMSRTRPYDTWRDWWAGR